MKSAAAAEACYTDLCLLTAALSGLPHQIRVSSPLLRFVPSIPLEPVIRFTRIHRDAGVVHEHQIVRW